MDKLICRIANEREVPDSRLDGMAACGGRGIAADAKIVWAEIR
jgi:hypothetical protein